MNNREVASIIDAELRVSAGPDGNKIISGLIPYNSRSVDLGGFTELIAPGAFSAALQSGSDVLALRDHDAKILLGRTKANTLKLTDSPEGLRYTINLPNTTQGNDLAESVSRGDLDSTSFGFVVTKDEWAATATEVVRTLVSVELLEVSPCSFPAYPASSVSIRTAPKEIQDRIQPTPEPEAVEETRDESVDEQDSICADCLAGDCADCSDDDCDCPNCDFDQASIRSLMEMALELRKRQ